MYMKHLVNRNMVLVAMAFAALTYKIKASDVAESTTVNSSNYTCPEGKWKAEGINHCCDNAVGGPPSHVGIYGRACLIDQTCKEFQDSHQVCTKHNRGWWGKGGKICKTTHKNVYKCIPTKQACQPEYKKVVTSWERFGSESSPLPVYSCAREGWTDWSDPFICHIDCGSCLKGYQVHIKYEWRVDAKRIYVKYGELCERTDTR